MSRSEATLLDQEPGQWEIKGIILIDWYLFACQYIPVRGVTAICGANGSGKSTILDAAQLVLQGGDKTRAVFNASGERVSRGEGRKLIDYCLGMLAPRSDGGVPTRDFADTRIALIFECRKTKKSLTAGLALSAADNDDEAKLESRFIIDGEVDETFFVSEGSDGESYVSDVAALEARAKERGLQFSPFSSSQQFAGALSRALQSSYGHYANPDLYRRAIKTALSLKEINNPDDFVKNFVLDPRPLNIEGLRGDIARYRTYRDQIKRIESEIGKLSKVIGKADECEVKLRELDFCEFADVNGRHRAAEIQFNAAKSKFDAKSKELEGESAFKERAKKRIEDLEEDLKTLHGQAANTEARHQLESLDKELKREGERREAAGKTLSGFYALCRKASDAIRHSSRADIQLGEAADSLNALSDLVGGPYSIDAFVGHVDGLVEHIGKAVAAISPVYEAARTFRDGKTHEKAIAFEAQKAVQVKVDRIKAGKANIHPMTEKFFNELHASGLHPQHLSALVDVTDESWRDAVEALLGRSREAIIVPPEMIERAMDLQKGDRRQYGDCELVYTRDADKHDRPTDPRSLAAVIKATDKYARAFVNVRLGGFVRVDDNRGFKDANMAVTRDLQVKRTMSVRTLRRVEGGYILGKTAQLSSLPALQAQAATHAAEVRELAEEIAEIEGFMACVEFLRQAAEISISALDEAETYRQSKRDEAQILKARAKLIEGEDSEILRQIADLDEDIAERKKEVNQTENRIVTLSGEIGELRTVLNKEQETLSETGNELSAWRFDKGEDVYQAAVNDFGHRVIRVAVGEKTEEVSVLKRVAHEGKTNAARLKKETDALRTEVSKLWSVYRTEYPSSDGDNVNFEVLAIREWCLDRRRFLVETDLVSYKEKTEEAYQTIEKGFMEDFLVRLKSFLEDMGRKIDDYNRVLRTKSFNGERYSFERKLKPEYTSIVRLARDSSGVSAEFKPESYKDAMATLQAMIDNPNFDATKFEDYREFHQYDIVIKNPGLTHDMHYSNRRSVNSGGEGQTPFYVTVATSLATAFHGSSERLDVEYYGFAPALFDEAFSKLDGVNITSSLKFMSDIRLQVIVAAPTEKRMSFMSNVDTMIDIVKDAESRTVFVDVAFVGERFRDEMNRNNPHLMTIEDYRERYMAQETEAASAGGAS